MSQNDVQPVLRPIVGGADKSDDLLHRDLRAERRKIQNRINQRTYRKRFYPILGKMTNIPSLGMRHNLKRDRSSPPKRWKVIGHLGNDNPSHSENVASTALAVSNPASDDFHHPRSFEGEFHCWLAPFNERERACQFQSNATRHYMQGDPQLDHLLTLVQINVYRALAENMNALGMDVKGWMHADAISPFCTFQPKSFDRTLPTHLQPTAIQRAIPHHPWLDFFPHPRMRDRLIFAADNYDDEELCTDIMGYWDDDKDDPALLVWGQPWDLMNWEMSEAFVRKWGWTVQDCPELFKSTNRWRGQRGEKRLSLK